MLVVAFEWRERKPSPAVPIPKGPHLERIVVANVVGGWSTSADDDMAETSSLSDSLRPPRLPQQWSWNGSNGQTTSSTSAKTSTAASSKTMLALWSRPPQDEATDELSFPRGAAITEVININEDWAWGVYCRQGGLFPANYAREIV